MRNHQIFFIICLVLGTTIILVAQGTSPAAVGAVTNSFVDVAAAADLSYKVDLIPLAAPPAFAAPDGPTAAPASDSCSLAPPLFANSFPVDAGQTLVNTMTEDVDDPILSCMWGNPLRSQGYRSVWYQFTAPTGGTIVIETQPNADYADNYDTVVAIHTGSCGSLVTLACNDDYNGFLSRASAPVVQGQTYYVEVVDWQFGINGDAILNLVATMTDIETRWEYVGEINFPRSRHMAVVVGNDIYVIGGQTVIGTSPTRTANLGRYNTVTGQWTPLTPMPGVTNSCADGFGYSNTSATHVNGKIYVPSGFTGNASDYCGLHFVYDIATNSWSTTNTAPWPGGEPLGWVDTAYFNDPPLTGYVVTGGLTGQPFTVSAVPTTTLLFYNVPTGSWDTLPAMGQARYGHTTGVLFDRYVCVAGGITQGGGLIAGVECYDMLVSTWSDIAPLNQVRFGADSVVAADGRWYVFGGIGVDSQGAAAAIPTTEVYDPVTNVWTELDTRYDLGTTADLDRPPRSWPRGGIIDNTVWMVGGNQVTSISTGQTLKTIERLPLPTTLPSFPPRAYFPIIFTAQVNGEPNNVFSNAIHLHEDVVHYDSFNNSEDFFDVFRFNITAADTYFVHLHNIPAGANFDLLIYDENKLLVGTGNRLGNTNEDVSITVGPGTYFALVIRAFPATGFPPPNQYRIWYHD